MCIATRLDPDIQKFITLAKLIGVETIQSMFGRSLYCDIVNRPSRPQNQVFLLRSAKKVELGLFQSRLTDNQSALAELKTLVETAVPKVIANFRIIFDEEQLSQAFLVNIFGEKSATRPIEYFSPKSLVTMYAHCSNLGNFDWCGSYRMIESFHKFCFDDKSEPYTRPKINYS